MNVAQEEKLMHLEETECLKETPISREHDTKHQSITKSNTAPSTLHLKNDFFFFCFRWCGHGAKVMFSKALIIYT